MQPDAAQMWRVDFLGGLEVLWGRFARFRFAPHTHKEYMIVVTESGTATPTAWGEVHRIKFGDLVVLNPDVVHGGGPAPNASWMYRSFYPPVSLMQRVARELSGQIPQFAPKVIHDPDLAARLLAAHRLLEKPATELARESALLEALAELVARHAIGSVSLYQEGDEHRAVTIARQYLDALPAENISLDDLAREAGISRFRLCRVFRRDTGLSPHAYQVLVRARHAKSLMMQGLPAAQAAVEAGFFDQAHLTRHFKRIYGVTPGRYSA